MPDVLGDPEGAEEEAIRRDRNRARHGVNDVDLSAWREQWHNATEEERAEWYCRGYTDVVAAHVADGLERDPELNRYHGGPTHKRVLDFGELDGEYLGGRRLIITVEVPQ